VFDIVTSLITWDSVAMYLEQRFTRPADGFVFAVALIKYRVVCPDKHFTPAALLAACDSSLAGRIPAPATPELAAWMEYDRMSSIALRAESSHS
jgi:hypothetical protein